MKTGERITARRRLVPGRSRWLAGVSAFALAACLAVSPARANPKGGVVADGQAAIAGEGSSAVTITQSSERAIIDWDSFSIDAGERTRFLQPGSASVTVNRVGGQDPSRIFGALDANGRIVLINRNGVLFGAGSSVDATGLLATTHELTDTDAFMAGEPARFDDGGVTGTSVVNEGTITIGDAGMAALVAPHVRNSGVISADLGRVTLGAASGFTVDLYGDGLISFAPGDEITQTLTDADGNPVAALVENDGSINAPGGQVRLTANAAREVINRSVNTSGIVRASSVSQANGVITLGGPGEVRVETGAVVSTSGTGGGGRIEVEAGSFITDGTVEADATAGAGGTITIDADAASLGGRLSASGASGGTISIYAEGLLSLAETIAATGAAGAGGIVDIRAGRVMESTTGLTEVRGFIDGGAITITADTQIASSGRYIASGTTGLGGRIAMTANDIRLFSAHLDATGHTRGGHVRIGGAFQGGKTPDPTQAYYDSFVGRWAGDPALANAQQTFLNDAAAIDVRATGGIGGTAIVWSDTTTTFLGSIDATGTAGGGSVEISSAQDLRYADLTSIDVGTGGHLLLDPKNITIGTATQISNWAYAGILGINYPSPEKNTELPALTAGDQLGRAVALNGAGDRLAVGAWFDDGSGNGVADSGAVYLFTFTDNDFSGGALAATIGADYSGGNNVDLTALEASDRFGVSVSLDVDGDRLAVGAEYDDGPSNGSTNVGAVYLFTFTDTNFSGGSHAATLGDGYTGGNNVDVSNLATWDIFGLAVSLDADGDRLAVGAIGDDGSGNSVTDAGAVYLFTFTDTSFAGGSLAATIGDGYSGGNNVDVSNLAASDFFGVGVSLDSDGDRLAASAEFDDGSGNSVTNAGAAYLFTFTDTSFTGGSLAATIGGGYSGGNNVDVSALEASDQFGSDISLNAAGDRLAVGALGDDGSGGATSGAGAAYLFTFTDTSFSGGSLAGTIGDAYTGSKDVDVSNLAADDNFGRSLSLNAAGDRLVVGAFLDDGSANATSNAGAAYLFTFTDTSFTGGTLRGIIGSGYERTGLDIDLSALEASDYFGRGIALNAAGDRLAVGAYHDSGSGNGVSDAGAVYLFTFSDTSFSGGALAATIGADYSGGNNVDVTTLEASDQFGTSVSLNAAGDRLAVGAENDDGSGNGSTNSGAVYLFTFDDAQFTSGKVETIIGSSYSGSKNVNVSALDADDRFGSGVSLNADGDRLAVGAVRDDGSSGSTTDAGAVYLFTFTDTSFSGGSLAATFGDGYSGGNNVDVSNLEADDRFGAEVSLNANGNRLAVGALKDDGSGNSTTDAGAAYLFTFTDTSFAGGSLAATIGDGYSGGNNVDVSNLAASDEFGSGVSLDGDGDRLAVGAVGDDGSGNAVSGAGVVYLFTFTDTSFAGGSLAATIGADYSGGKDFDLTSLEASDGFGRAVALNASGNRLAISAIGDDGSGNGTSDAGAAYLFTFTDTSFSGASLASTIGDGYTGGANVNVSALGGSDRFGAGVSLNAAGDRLAVGAELDDGSAGATANAGAVYLFTFTDTDFSGGALAATIGDGYTGGNNVDVSTLDAGDAFGASVALNAAGNRLAAGAVGDNASDNSGNDTGAIYLFTFTDTSFAGGSLAATVGSGYTGGNNIDTATVENSDGFGTAVSLNAAGDRLAVGSLNDDGSGNATHRAGAVYLFSFADTSFSSGSLAATIGDGYSAGKNVDVSNLEVDDQFGAGVSLNAAGDRLAVGANQDDGRSNATSNSGAVYLFTFTDTSFSGGSLAATIGDGYTGGNDVDVSNLEAGDEFGYGVSLDSDGDRLAVGAQGDDGSGDGVSGAGAAYIFTFTDTSFSGGSLEATIGAGYASGLDLDVTGLEASDGFGVAVSLNAAGDRLAVGAFVEDGFGNGTTDAGAVYLFRGLTTGSVASGGSYASHQTGSLTITPADIVDILDDGTAVTLQASNDITVSSAITVSGTPSSIGALTLQAGRSILINANITTTANSQSGAVSLFANDLLANGVIDGQRDTGSAAITMASGTAINAGTAAVSIELRAGTGKTYTASGDITLDDITASTISAINSGPTSGSGIILNSGATLTASSTSGTSITLAGDDFTNNAGSGALSTTGSGRFLVWSGDPSADNRGSLTHDFKQYNATYGVTSVSGGSAQDGFLYTLAPTITPSLTGTVSKTYDTNTTATLASGNYTLSGNVDSDTVTLNNPTSGTYDDKTVGTSKTVTATGISVASTTNSSVTVYGYQLASTSANGNVGTITAVSLTGGLTGTVSKTYDATTTATLASGNYSLSGVLSGDTVSLNNPSSGTYDNKTVGTGKTVTVTGLSISGADSGNYTLSSTSANAAIGTVSAASLTITGASAANKVYDAGTTATVTGGSLSGVLSGDTVTLNTGSASGTFADKNVGSGKAVTASGYAISGTDAGNYSLTQPTGLTANITAASLTAGLTGTVSKTYDTTTTATLASGNYTLSGVLSGDTVSLNNPSSGTYDNKTVGTGKTVTVTGLSISGTDSANYTLASTSANGAIGTVTAATLTVTADDATRVAGTANPTFTSSISGLASGEGESVISGLTLSTSATAASAAGQYAIVASGASATNYVFAYVDGVLTVTQAATTTVSADVNDSALRIAPWWHTGAGRADPVTGPAIASGDDGGSNWRMRPTVDRAAAAPVETAANGAAPDGGQSAWRSFACSTSADGALRGVLRAAAAAITDCN